MPISIRFAELAASLTPDTLILTPNSRTQKAVIAGLLASTAEGEVVESVTVLSLTHWFESLWQELSFATPLPKLIGNLEIKAWLKEQIGKDQNWQLTNELGVAEKILEAYRNLTQWNLTLDALPETESVETKCFIKWIGEFDEFCKLQNLLPQFSQGKLLVTHFAQLIPAIQQNIVCIGFNQLTPLETKFLNLCAENQVRVSHHYPEKVNNQRYRVELAHFEAELEFAADLAYQLTNEDPKLNIAVVVHQLANHIDSVHQVFSERFQEDEWKPWQSLQKIKYNVSAGLPLAEVPKLNVAIKILTLNQHRLELQDLQLLKCSPFIDWGESADTIKSFLHEQVLLGYASYNISRLLNVIQNHINSDQLALLKTRLQSLQNRPNRARPVSAWVDVWKSELIEWGWWSQQNIRASDDLLYTSFSSSLNDCLNLAYVAPTCSARQSIEYLQQVLRQNTFQLPSDRTNVHILGMLEATGLEFERLVLVGFNRENWPQKAKSNPFLPNSFQQQYQMPGSSAEREFVYAQDMTQSLLKSAEQVWITNSISQEVDVSAEMAFVSEVDVLSAENFIEPRKKESVKSDYQWHCDEEVDITAGSISGGAYLLSNYAACPFRALSRFCFKLKAGEKVQKGVEAKVKGAWLHRAMEFLWMELEDQASLNALSDNEIEDLVKSILSRSQAEFESQLHANAPSEIIELEYQKLNHQILDWLEIEKQRAPFRATTEIEKQLSVGDLSFKFRVDRIDYLENDKVAIIDYKTGHTDVKKWLGERPDEAQMPAYVLACEQQDIASLSYAKLKTGEVSREGIWFSGEEEQSPFRFRTIDADSQKDRTKYILAKPELIDTSRTLQQQWRESLTAIADNISSGKMPVSPKNINETCRFCEFSDFCRIQEVQPQVPSSDGGNS